MKKKEKTSMQHMTPAELQKQIVHVRHTLAMFSAHRYSKPPKNVREGRALRKKIAAMLTVLRHTEARK